MGNASLDGNFPFIPFVLSIPSIPPYCPRAKHSALPCQNKNPKSKAFGVFTINS